MWMRLVGLLLLATLSIVSVSGVALADQTIYLIRHAEKVKDDSSDPALTTLGKARAETFATYFKDIELVAVYSSDYLRTRDTAAPTAKIKGIAVKLYDAGKLQEIAAQAKKVDGDLLIVGHSNTTAIVANMIAGGELPDLEDHHYDRIYIVKVKDDGSAEVTIDHVEPYTP